MPAIESQFRYQKAVLWFMLGFNENGKAIVPMDATGAVELDVRWSGVETDGNAAQQSNISEPTTVVVDRPIAIGSFLRLGAIGDVPTPVNNLMRVTGYNSTPDIKCRNFFRTVTLVRHTNDEIIPVQ